MGEGVAETVVCETQSDQVLLAVLEGVHNSCPKSVPQKPGARGGLDMWRMGGTSSAPHVMIVDQHPDVQLDALKSLGCDRLLVDHASGALEERRELARVLDGLRPGDTHVVWS